MPCGSDPVIALSARVVGAFAGWGASTVGGRVTEMGELLAAADATKTVAVYVPSARPDWFALSTSVVGAVPERLTESQPVGWPAAYVTVALRPLSTPSPA